MVTTKFSELLDEYLMERDRQKSDYYDNRFIGDRMKGCWMMEDLAKQMDEMIYWG